MNTFKFSQDKDFIIKLNNDSFVLASNHLFERNKNLEIHVRDIMMIKARQIEPLTLEFVIIIRNLDEGIYVNEDMDGWRAFHDWCITKFPKFENNQVIRSMGEINTEYIVWDATRKAASDRPE